MQSITSLLHSSKFYKCILICTSVFLLLCEPVSAQSSSILIEKESEQILFEENADTLFETDIIENLLFINVYLKEYQTKEVNNELIKKFRNILLNNGDKEKIELLDKIQTTKDEFFKKMKADFECILQQRNLLRTQTIDLKKGSVREIVALVSTIQKKLDQILPEEQEFVAVPQRQPHTAIKKGAPNLSGIKVQSIQKDGNLLLESSNKTMNGKNKQLLVVILNEPDANKIHQRAAHLLLIGYRDHETLKILSKDTTFYEVDILKGSQSKLTVKPERDVYATIKKDQILNIKSIISINLEFPSPLIAPINKDDKIGKIIITISGKEIARTDLIAAESIKKGSFIKRLTDNFNVISKTSNE